MTVRVARIGLALVEVFVALTAIGGGGALLAGLEAERYPLESLAGTPFSSFLMPALLLAIVVGGSAAVAAMATLVVRFGAWRVPGSGAAGVILMGWILGEVLILRPVSWTWIEIVCFGLGIVMLAAALFEGWQRNRLPRQEAQP